MKYLKNLFRNFLPRFGMDFDLKIIGIVLRKVPSGILENLC
jgi:hypothetical protein